MEENKKIEKGRTAKFFDWGNRNLGAVFGAIILTSSIFGLLYSHFNNQKSFQSLKKSAQIVGLTIDHEHYEADSCIVCCIDDRFTPMIDRFTNKNGYKKVDMIKVAGGAKDLISSGIKANLVRNQLISDYLCKQIAKSIELHHTKRVDIMIHIECGAYDGKNDENFSIDELSSAKTVIEDYLKDAGYNPAIHAYIETFDGLYELN